MHHIFAIPSAIMSVSTSASTIFPRRTLHSLLLVLPLFSAILLLPTAIFLPTTTVMAQSEASTTPPESETTPDEASVPNDDDANSTDDASAEASDPETEKEGFFSSLFSSSHSDDSDSNDANDASSPNPGSHAYSSSHSHPSLFSRNQLMDFNPISLGLELGVDSRTSNSLGFSIHYQYSPRFDFNTTTTIGTYDRNRARYNFTDISVNIKPYFYDHFFALAGLSYQSYGEGFNPKYRRHLDDTLVSDDDDEEPDSTEISFDDEKYHYHDSGLWLNVGLGSRFNFKTHAFSLTGIALSGHIELQKMILQIDESYKDYRPLAVKILGMQDAVLSFKFSTIFLL